MHLLVRFCGVQLVSYKETVSSDTHKPAKLTRQQGLIILSASKLAVIFNFGQILIAKK